MERLQADENLVAVGFGPKCSASSLVRLSQTCRSWNQLVHAIATAILASDELVQLGNAEQRFSEEALGLRAAAIPTFYALLRLAREPVPQPPAEFGWYVCIFGENNTNPADVSPVALEKIYLFSLAIGEAVPAHRLLDQTKELILNCAS